ARLSRIWTAPMSHYAPPFMKSAVFGYILSAMTGCGLILLVSLTTAALVKPLHKRESQEPEAPSAGTTTLLGTAGPTENGARSGKRKRGTGFVERTADHILRAFEYALDAESLANKHGLLQSIDPRVKVIGMLSLIVATAMARNIATILGILVVVLAAGALSRIPIRTLGARIWIAAFVFSGVVALPAIFISEGRVIARVPLLGWPII